MSPKPGLIQYGVLREAYCWFCGKYGHLRMFCPKTFRGQKNLYRLAHGLEPE